MVCWPAATAFPVEGFTAAIAFDIYFQDRGMMNEAIDSGERHGLVREDLARKVKKQKRPTDQSVRRLRLAVRSVARYNFSDGP